jgi:hypothetical protein
MNIHNLKLLLAIRSNGTSQVTSEGCETDCNDSRLDNWVYLMLHSFRYDVQRTVTIHFLWKWNGNQNLTNYNSLTIDSKPFEIFMFQYKGTKITRKSKFHDEIRNQD